MEEWSAPKGRPLAAGRRGSVLPVAGAPAGIHAPDEAADCYTAPVRASRRWCDRVRLAVPLASSMAAAGLLAAEGTARPLPSEAWPGLLLGLLSSFLWGLLLAIPGTSIRERARPLRWTLGAVLGLAWSLLAALRIGHIRYLAALGRLPSIGTFGHLGTMGGLAASLQVHAPPGRVALELLLPIGAGALWAAWWLQRPPCTPRRARGASLLLGALGLLGLLGPRALEGPARLAGRDPLLHWVLALREREHLDTERSVPETPPPLPLVARVQGALGTEEPGPPLDPRYPLCRGTGATPRPPDPPPRRRVLVTLLEGVGSEALELRRPDGSPLMPALHEAAARGVLFPHFFVPGDSSAQALVALLSGVAPPPFRRVLRHAPLVRLPSLAADLRAAGYLTAYFHGSDLSFEQQRLYLQRSDFQVLWEPDPTRPRIGWGMPDGQLFDRFVQWLEAHPGTPVLSVLATVGTHDPYALPAGAERPFREGSDWDRYRNALAELDRHLGRFLAWVEHHEPPDTIVAILGDHPPRVGPRGRAVRSDGRHLSFRVPLVLLGLDDRERAQAEAAARSGPSAIYDLPQTLLGLLGWQRLGCYQGRDLLRRHPPSHRLSLSLVGENLEWMVLRTAEERWTLHLPSRRVWARRLGEGSEHDVLLHGREVAPMLQFAREYLSLGTWLNLGDHFVPSTHREPARLVPIEPLPEPLLVAHRGNLHGPGGLPKRPENSLELLRAAAAAGVPWVELDVQVTAGGDAVVFHDGEVVIDGARRPLHRISLQRLREAAGYRVPTLKEVVDALGGRIGLAVELKPQPVVFAEMDLLRAALEALRRLPPGAPLIVDSFSRTMLRSILTHGGWDTGYDLPLKPVRSEWLRYAADAGFRWVYVHVRFASSELVRQARSMGLRTMIYGVESPEQMELFGATRPDGVITDYPLRWTSHRGAATHERHPPARPAGG